MIDPIDVGDVITLTEEENGEEMDFKIMYIFEVGDKKYLCLVPVDQENNDEYDVHFLRYDGTDVLHPIETDEEWEMVEATFDTLVEEFSEKD